MEQVPVAHSGATPTSPRRLISAPVKSLIEIVTLDGSAQRTRYAAGLIPSGPLIRPVVLLKRPSGVPVHLELGLLRQSMNRPSTLVSPLQVVRPFKATTPFTRVKPFE